MLTASSFYKNIIDSGTNRVFDIKVTITRNDTGAQPLDISDRVVSYSTQQDFESRNGRLNLELDNYDYQLSPLNRISSFNLDAGVYDPLLDSNHKVELYEGLLVNGSFEYIKKFVGYIGDEISVSSSPTIQLSCRDKSKLMQDIYIYQGPSYSLMLVEDVIQDMINEFMPFNQMVILQVQDPTQYMIGRPDGAYTAKDTNLWDACQLLADSASQELRFLEDGTLIMRKVDRDFSDKTPNLRLDLSNLISDDMSISDADVRNHIVVKVQGYDPITAKDIDSINKYGRRYMEVTRSMSDIITDVSQAHELAENILRDLRYANPTESAELPLHPLVQVGDIVTITNPRLGTNSINDIFKVVSVSNNYTKDNKRTRLELIGHDKFLSDPLALTNPPTGLTYVMQKRTIQNYKGSGWFGYEKEQYFPMLKWTPPTKDVNNVALPPNFGGYIIERATLIDLLGKNLTGTYRWTTIASIPSYIGALDKKIDYFYDYSVSSVIDKYIKLGATGNSVTVKYRICAVNSQGKKTAKTAEMSVVVSYPKYKDAQGNYLN